MTSTILFNLMERNVWSCMLQMVNGLMSPAHGLLTSFVKSPYYDRYEEKESNNV